jgi:hypothetical protein
MSKLRRAVWTVGALLGLPGLAQGQSNARRTGPVIDTIIVVTHDIYAPEEASRSAISGIMNALHVTTRPSVVRHELLFRVGEPFDPLKVAETARNLRARGLFRSVQIDSMRVEDKLAVLVRTSDGWTTTLSLSANFSGGEFVWGLGGQERNLLGTGARAGLFYRQEVDRTAFTITGGMDRISGTRAGVSGFWDALSDGNFAGWKAGAPFRAISDPWGFDTDGDAGRQRILQFRNGDSVETYLRRTFRQLAWGGWATEADVRGYVRVGFAAQIKREEYTLWDVDETMVPDTVQAAIGAWIDVLDPQYTVVTHYNGFAREVDVDLSTQVLVGAWLAPDGLGYPRTGVGPVLIARAGASLGPTFGWINVAANGLFSSAGLDSGTVLATGTVVGQFIRKNSTVLHVEFGARKGTPPGMEFDLGLRFGPRAFQAHAFTGDRMIWGTLEPGLRWRVVRRPGPPAGR